MSSRRCAPGEWDGRPARCRTRSLAEPRGAVYESGRGLSAARLWLSVTRGRRTAYAALSGGLPVVRLQQSAEPLTTKHRTFGRHRRLGLDDSPAQHPMWTFPEITGHVLANNEPDVLLSEQDHLVQAFGLDGQDKPLRVRRQIRRPLRKLQSANARSLKRVVELFRIQRIAVMD
jgi:hypothetical protein